MASVAIAGPGLYEVIAEVDDATPGTGIALLNAKGEPLEGIEFGREGRTNLAFGFGNPQEQPSGWAISISPIAPCRWPGRGNGCGWSWPADRRNAGSAATASIGAACSTGATDTGPGKRSRFTPAKPAIAANPDNAARHIRLRSLQVRELSGLTTAVAADLLAKAAAAGVAMKIGQGESPQAWTQRIARLAPAGPSPAAWRYACTLQALAAAGAIRRGRVAAARAVRERLGELRSTQAKIDLLQDAALVWRSRLEQRPTAVGALGPAWPRTAQCRRPGRFRALPAGPHADFPRRSARTQRPHLLGACPRCHDPVLRRTPRGGSDPHGESRRLLAGQRPAGRRLARGPATRPVAAMVECSPHEEDSGGSRVRRSISPAR